MVKFECIYDYSNNQSNRVPKQGIVLSHWIGLTINFKYVFVNKYNLIEIQGRRQFFLWRFCIISACPSLWVNVLNFECSDRSKIYDCKYNRTN